jgi:hypothetical protein
MTQTYRTLRLARSDEGVLGVVFDAPPMNLTSATASNPCDRRKADELVSRCSHPATR